MGCTYNGCGGSLPKPIVGRCDTKRRTGGISRLVFAPCWLNFKNINDPAEWCDFVSRGIIVASGELVGSKPKSSPVKKKISACRSETTIGEDFTLNFTDHTADNIDFSDFDFWNTIKQQTESLIFGFVTCEGLFYGFTKFGIEVDQVIEDSNNGTSFWEGIMAWQGNQTIEPITVPNLENILIGDCTGVPNFDACAPGVLTSNNGGVLCDSEGILLTATFFTNTTYRWFRGQSLSTINVEIPSAQEHTLQITNLEDPSLEGEWYAVEITRQGCSPALIPFPNSPIAGITDARPIITVTATSIPNAVITITPAVAGSYDFSLEFQGIIYTNIPS
ncbi:MAG: hypothetical protein ACRC78_00920, partial [Planktothrix sp.]